MNEQIKNLTRLNSIVRRAIGLHLDGNISYQELLDRIVIELAKLRVQSR